MFIQEWKKIKFGLIDSKFSISNDGKVRDDETNTELKSILLPNGYMSVNMYSNNMNHPKTIHRLVGEYFVLNDDIIHKTQIDHIDGNKLNNLYTNLEWVTPKENKRRSIILGLCNPKHGHQKKGSESGVSKHTETDAHLVCKLLELGLSNKEISKTLDLSTEFVRSIKRKRAWVDISISYNIPNSESRNYYDDEFRNKIRNFIDQNYSDLDIAIEMGLPDPSNYGRKYVNKIRSRYLKS